MADRIEILGFAGSLRKGSYNKAILRAAKELAPANTAIDIFDLEGIPPYDQDLDHDMPARVREFKGRIRKADALLIATPEYNYSVPGVLKNAIDWVSRANGENAWAGKPAAVMGVSTGLMGTVRAQYHLRQIFVFLDMHPVNKPEVMVSRAAEKFDADLRLVDEKTRELVAALLQGLVSWTRRLSGGGD